MTRKEMYDFIKENDCKEWVENRIHRHSYTNCTNKELEEIINIYKEIYLSEEEEKTAEEAAVDIDLEEWVVDANNTLYDVVKAMNETLKLLYSKRVITKAELDKVSVTLN